MASSRHALQAVHSASPATLAPSALWDTSCGQILTVTTTVRSDTSRTQSKEPASSAPTTVTPATSKAIAFPAMSPPISGSLAWLILAASRSEDITKILRL